MNRTMDQDFDTLGATHRLESRGFTREQAEIIIAVTLNRMADATTDMDDGVHDRHAASPVGEGVLRLTSGGRANCNFKDQTDEPSLQHVAGGA